MEAGFFSGEGVGGMESAMRVRSFSSARGGVVMGSWERGARISRIGARLACKGSETVDERLECGSAVNKTSNPA